MIRAGWLVSFACLLAPAALSAQTAPAPQSSFGLKLGKVPEVVFSQLPQLPKDHGVLVEDVSPDSPAWRGGLRRHDIVLSLETKPVASAEKLLEDLHGAEQVTEVIVFRSGREVRLKFAPHAEPATAMPLKGFIKPGGPPAVRVQAQPLDKGRLNITLQFYSDNSGKLEQPSYVGELPDIERQIQAHARDRRLPPSVVDLVEVALKRLRNLEQK